MVTKSSKAGDKDALTAEKSEASKHLKSSKPKPPAAKGGKPAAKK